MFTHTRKSHNQQLIFTITKHVFLQCPGHESVSQTTQMSWSRRHYNHNQTIMLSVMRFPLSTFEVLAYLTCRDMPLSRVLLWPRGALSTCTYGGGVSPIFLGLMKTETMFMILFNIKHRLIHHFNEQPRFGNYSKFLHMKFYTPNSDSGPKL